jgi:signal transduction histidine kinase/ActR/RegA family two-component response regulator
MGRSWLFPTVLGTMTALFIVVIILAARQNVRQTQALLDVTNLVKHTRDVQREVDAVLLAMTEAETGQRGYLLTGNTAYLAPYDTARAEADASLASLADLTKDNPRQQTRVDELRNATEARWKELVVALDTRHKLGLAQALLTMTSDARSMDRIRQLASDISLEETNLLTERQALRDLAFRSAVTGRVASGFVSASLLVVLAVLAFAQARARERTIQREDLERRARQRELEDSEQRYRDAAEREQLARAEAEQANRLKDEFLAVLSHELRTPLNAVLGWTQILQAGTVPEKTVRRALSSIKRNAESQQRLVEDLLDVSRIITGKFPLDRKPSDLRLSVTAAIDAVRPDAEAKHIELRTTLNGSLVVNADPYRIQQVAANLLSNAVKFTPPGGHVDVSVTARDDGAVLVVQDTGVGIAPALQPHIFDRFRQGDSSRTRAHGGLGLGLAIVKHIVDAHGGTIFVESGGDGMGSTFRVFLPWALSPLEDLRDQPGRAAASLPGGLSGIRLLVVDDEPDSVELLSYSLAQVGGTVTAARSGHDALVALKHHRPDVVLTDIQMPEMDGFELLDEIRRISTNGPPPVIAITAHARGDDATRAADAGFAAHVTKPVDLPRLVSTIRVVLKRQDESNA